MRCYWYLVFSPSPDLPLLYAYTTLHTHHEFTPSHSHARMYFCVFEALVVDGDERLALFVLNVAGMARPN